ncbi:MAG: transposase [Desulfatitalea sp.]|nr:helix-turn-helix domain-containing protein [Desulfatitalea sp.]NNK02103.1 transposase [Desulfatitalea sp.]
MDVSDYKFDSDEIQKLQEHRDNQQDARLQARFIAMLMLAEKIELKTIASIIGKSAKTIENWYHQYKTKGIESLNSFQYKPKQSYLTAEQINQVASWVKETNPGKTKEVSEYIKAHFQVTYSNEAVRKMLHKMGLKVLRPKVIPGNPPSEEEQKKHRAIFRNETQLRSGNCVFVRRWDAFDPSKCSWSLLG